MNDLEVCNAVPAVSGQDNIERAQPEYYSGPEVDQTIHIDRNETVERLASAAFPNYNGRTFKVRVTSHALNVKSYWDGGSRDYFVFLKLATLETMPVPQQSAFDAQIPGADSVRLPNGIVCVKHSFFCGKDMGITVIVSPSNCQQFLPKPMELSREEKIVLAATLGLKSSYAGISNYRHHEAQRHTGITLDAYNAAKTTLIGKGLLNKSGAITANGRNAIGHTDLYQLSKPA